MALSKRMITPLRLKQNDQLAASEARYRRLFETAEDGILILEADTGRIIDANPFLMKLLGYTKTELCGMQLWQIGLFGDIDSNKAAFEELQQNGYVRYDDLPLRTKTGQAVAVEFVSNTYMVDQDRVIQCNIRDISKRKITEAELRKNQEKCVNNAFLAHYDPLTQLPNRNMLYNRLEESVQVARREKKHLSLIFLDLDNFKSILNCNCKLNTSVKWQQSQAA